MRLASTLKHAWLAAPILALSAVPSIANDAQLLDVAAEAYFHVDVTGTPRLQDHPLHAADRSGKAFAVGPNLLVTARHVLGDADEWRLAEIENPILARATEPLDRQIMLRSAQEAQATGDAVVVAPSSTTLNAAGLRLTTREVGAHFDLSFCQITEDGRYRAVMGGGADPASDTSVSPPAIVPLLPVGPGTGLLGGLYVFDLAGGAAGPVMTDWGHDGSPIVDEQNHVVAIVSAYTTHEGRPRVLATPVQPLIPGSLRQLAQEPDPAPRQVARRRCSMADTVKRIHDSLNVHSVWNVTVDKNLDPASGRMLPSGDIIVEYENVAEKPNVKQLIVVYDVVGKRSPDRDDLGAFAPPADVPTQDRFYEERHELHVKPDRGKRRFVLEDMDELIEKYEIELREDTNNGFIQEVVLYLYPLFEGKSEPERRFVKRRIPYVELR